MALTTSITFDPDASPDPTLDNYAGLCMLSWSAKDTTLGSGDLDDHSPMVRIKSAPAGWGYRFVSDPRPGAQQGALIDLMDWHESWVFAIYPDVAGDYTVEWSITDESDGSNDTAEDTQTVTDSSPTIVYCDGNATGAGDGTSWADAYTLLEDAIDDAGTVGSNVKILIAGGQTYTPVGENSDTFVNFAGVWDGTTGGTAPIIDLKDTDSVTPGEDSLIRFGANSKNFGWVGCLFTDSSQADATAADKIPFDYANGTTCRNFFLVECGTSDDGHLRSAFAEGTGDGCDLLLHGCNSPVEVRRYQVGFLQSNVLVVGCYFDTTVEERPHRTSLGTTAMIGTEIRSDFKSCTRYTGTSDYHTLDKCYFHVDTDLCTCVTVGQDNETPGSVRAIRSILVCEYSGTCWSETGTGTAVTNRGSKIQGCVFRSTSTDNTQPMIAVGSNYQRFKMLNSLATVNSGDVSQRLFYYTQSGGYLQLQGNIFKDEGPTPNQNYRIMMRFNAVPTTAIIQDNVFDRGNVPEGQMFVWAGSIDDLADFESTVTGASDNVEQSVTLDANYLPSPTTTVDTPSGLEVDYYSNALGATMYAGAVQSVPVSTAPDTGNLRRRIIAADMLLMNHRRR